MICYRVKCNNIEKKVAYLLSYGQYYVLYNKYIFSSELAPPSYDLGQKPSNCTGTKAAAIRTLSSAFLWKFLSQLLTS